MGNGNNVLFGSFCILFSRSLRLAQPFGRLAAKILHMLTAIRQNWKDFKAGTPGHRFQDIHSKRRKQPGQGKGNGFKKWGIIGLGILLSLTGIFFMAVPGPGLLILAPGLVLIAGESLLMARLLDWAEVRGRAFYEWAKARWQKASDLAKLGLIILTILIVVAALVSAYLIFFR